ncbi:2-oxoacid:acceptor oxidoreductase family protein [Anaerotignum sp. MB30-C6]|uniref:2-oxoacid:acceptor oxidoreductase family protein n=1 Tax=Anaerotignum sp. MB30-C6 TaxID=3070814 RepID=UPI0027DE0E45|nr:2-oxoacid:acceptor oxidoreductase family protein [Anaerotignum sp. MB30-C6]WMI80245.1 2-oxoacid:acceptor oxidoreductase family protein [Anaerotignum sp. MB30-C6]
MNTQRICCAGFGGQGTLSMGKILAYAGMLEGHEVSWCPSYGPEMRGGTANCHVIVSDEPIGSPVITSDANCVIAMNQPSLDKFVGILAKGGALVVNSDLASLKEDRADIRVLDVPANTMATQEFGSAKLANIILLGAVIQATGSVKIESIDDAFTHVFGGAKAKFIPNNKKAFEMGFEFAKNNK